MSIEILAAQLSAEPIFVDVAVAAVEAPGCGAVVSFSGVVRNHDGGKDVLELGYSAHPSAERVLAEVVDGVLRAHGSELDAGGSNIRIWAAHRIGPLRIGDAALVCAVATAHRQLAFSICAALVDRIKDEVPIWKEQFFADGSVEWVGAGSSAAPR
ncbi:molybdenum cofactor biosynthesis protein MoaE [Arthrobacter sp. A5]|uniref:molybdenum cofactor biosynthesis protein MoaE n=1 Tax=Arthrobacter sp. A5 TaxID=576926 RepID=UPI003DA97B0A